MKQYRLLIADDEQQIRDGICCCVPWERENITVAALAESGAQALQLLMQLKPDAAIIDVNMPDISGLEVIQRAIAAGITDTAFLVLSGYDQFAYVQRALQLHADNYLLKPCSPEDLLASVKKALLEHSHEPDVFSHRNTPQAPILKTKQSAVDAAVTYIEAHYRQMLSLESVAEAVGVSAPYLSSLFSKERKWSFVDCVNITRIEAAKQLLDAGVIGNYEIAAAVGFSSEKYFSRVFKKYTGFTVQEYRKGG